MRAIPHCSAKCCKRLIAYHTMHTLRHLELSSFPIDWSSVALPNLTHLIVHGFCHASGRGAGYDIDELSKALMCMPCLEDLDLCQTTYTTGTRSPLDGLTPAIMPHLRSLRLWLYISACILILKPLYMPALQYLAVIAIVGGPVTELYSAIVKTTMHFSSLKTLAFRYNPGERSGEV